MLALVVTAPNTWVLAELIHGLGTTPQEWDWSGGAIGLRPRKDGGGRKGAGKRLEALRRRRRPDHETDPSARLGNVYI